MVRVAVEPLRCDAAGSSTDRATLGTAAWWYTTSIPRTARAAVTGSEQSPSTSSTPAATGARFSRRPPCRLSRTRTRWPASTKASARWLPMKPAPPVTRILIRANDRRDGQRDGNRASPDSLRRSAPGVWGRDCSAPSKTTSAEQACKPDPVPPESGGDHSSSPAVARGVQRPTRGLRPGQPRTPPYLVLLRVGFSLPALSPGRRCALTAPFHPCRPGFPGLGGVFSVALSLGSPPLAVSQHTALGVRTFLPGPDDEPRRPPGLLCGHQ